MKRKKLKRRFGDITPSIFNKMSSRERQPIAKYNGMMDIIDKWYEEIEDHKHHIEQIEKDIRRYAKSCEKIYEKQPQREMMLYSAGHLLGHNNLYCLKLCFLPKPETPGFE